MEGPERSITRSTIKESTEGLSWLDVGESEDFEGFLEMLFLQERLRPWIKVIQTLGMK